MGDPKIDPNILFTIRTLKKVLEFWQTHIQSPSFFSTSPISLAELAACNYGPPLGTLRGPGYVTIGFWVSGFVKPNRPTTLVCAELYDKLHKELGASPLKIYLLLGCCPSLHRYSR